MIIHFAISKSACTFVYQIIKELFPSAPIIRLHQFKKFPKNWDDFVILQYRDFRDVVVSEWRFDNFDANEIDENNLPQISDKKVLLKYCYKIERQCRSLNAMHEANKDHPSLLCLRYEDFFGDNNFLFNSLSKLFCEWDINPELRKQLSEKYSFDSNKAISDKNLNRNKIDKDSLIHGNHMFKGEVGGWKKWIVPELHDTFNILLKEYLEQWKYGK